MPYADEVDLLRFVKDPVMAHSRNGAVDEFL